MMLDTTNRGIISFSSGFPLKVDVDESKSGSERKDTTYQNCIRPHCPFVQPPQKRNCQNVGWISPLHTQDSNLVHYACPISYNGLIGKTMLSIICVRFPHRESRTSDRKEGRNFIPAEG